MTIKKASIILLAILVYGIIIFMVYLWANQSLVNFVSFPELSTAYSITIIDNWDGLAPDAPINSLYTLKNPTEHIEDGQFQGSALFSVGGNFADTKKETAQISVPKDVIQAFLQRLSEVSPENGTYQPFMEHTDDYPEITIRVLYGNAKTIEFYTTSQGDEHIPWKVTYNSNSYVVKSGIPMQALEILKPYLAQDVLDNLVK
jgi:hypothetical protein